MDGPGELARVDALLFGRHDVEREDGEHRSVHRHRNAHLVERDAVEQDTHVLDRVDCDAGHADVAYDPGMVGVVSTVGCQIEGDRQPLLAGREISAVEGVALLGSREARVLPDGPRPAHIHRRIWATQKGRDAGHRLKMCHRIEILEGVHRIDFDSFGRIPTLVGSPTGKNPPIGEWRSATPRIGVEIDLAEVGQAAHAGTPMASRTRVITLSTSAPTKMNSLAPSSRIALSRLPGRPATTTRSHPAFFKASTAGSSIVS